MKITTIRLPASNVHVVAGARGTVLVDAGTEAAVPRLRRQLARLGVDPRALRAVVLTHGHADHAGGARALVGDGVPILIGAADADMVRRGHNPELHPTNLTAKAIRRFVDRPFTGYEPDRLVDGVLDLDVYGIDAKVVPAPAHTPGSIAIVGNRPDMPAVVGDLIRGGHFGGAIAPSRPARHYYSEDTDRDLSLLSDLIRRHRPSTLHLGHGGPVTATAATQLAERQRQGTPTPRVSRPPRSP